MRAAAVVGCLLLAAPADARGQDSPLAPPGEWPDEVFEAPGDGARDDSQNDRAVLATTAQIQPAGTLTLQVDGGQLQSDTFALSDLGAFFGAKYAVLPRLQLSVMWTPDFSHTGSVGFKAQAVRRPSWQIATYGSMFFLAIREADLTGFVNGGVVGTRCLDVGCHSLVSANVAYVAGFSGLDELQEGTVSASLSLIARLTEHVKLVVESQVFNVSMSSSVFEPKGQQFVGLRVYGLGSAVTVLAQRDSGDVGRAPNSVWIVASYRL